MPCLSIKHHGKEVAMSEPREEDDTALGKDNECEDCGNFMFTCECKDPDKMHDEMYED
jgi:hypothetical protein